MASGISFRYAIFLLRVEYPALASKHAEKICWLLNVRTNYTGCILELVQEHKISIAPHASRCTKLYTTRSGLQLQLQRQKQGRLSFLYLCDITMHSNPAEKA